MYIIMITIICTVLLILSPHNCNYNTFDPNKPLEAARKAHNHCYVDIMSNLVLLTPLESGLRNHNFLFTHM